MATVVAIRGLTGRGFRVKNSAGAWKTVKEKIAIDVDIDDRSTQTILSRERDNFIRVTNTGATTAQIIGLDRRGFRIVNNGGSTVTVRVGNGAPTTVNLDDTRVLRVLQRNRRLWVRSTSVSTLSVRGLTAAQASPNLEKKSAATAVLNSTGTAPADNATVTINDRTYRWKTAIAQAGDVLIGASSDAALDNLALAVNGGAGSGTNYFAGTLKPTGVTAGARSGTGASATLTFTASGVGAEANTFASTETSGQTAFTNGATFTGGQSLVTVRRGATVAVDPRLPRNYQQLRRHYRSWVEA
jgi:hypothetical protein